MKNMSSTRVQSIMFTLFLGLLVFLPIQASSVQATSSTTVNVVPSSSTPSLGETFTVNLTIGNVQNLYGLDITLNWNVSVLQVLNVNSRLGVESHPDGVLHENLPDYPIEVIEENLSLETGNYQIAATSVGSTSAFSGSGNVAILTFNVTSLGQAAFELESELADKPVSDEANFIEHSEYICTVNIIPEFPTIIAVGLFVLFTSALAVCSRKRLQHATPSC